MRYVILKSLLAVTVIATLLVGCTGPRYQLSPRPPSSLEAVNDALAGQTADIELKDDSTITAVEQVTVMRATTQYMLRDMHERRIIATGDIRRISILQREAQPVFTVGGLALGLGAGWAASRFTESECDADEGCLILQPMKYLFFLPIGGVIGMSLGAINARPIREVIYEAPVDQYVAFDHVGGV